MYFAQNVKEWRMRRGLTQEALAEALCVSRQSVAKWEAGQSMPDLERLLTICGTLDVSADRLLKAPVPCEERADVLTGIGRCQLSAFLRRASAATYAGYGAEESVPTRPGSHDLRYEESPYLYIDTWLGGDRFGGEEAVFADGRAVWLMNYCGHTLSDGFSGDFLKEALRNRPEAYPFRGPLCYRRNEFSYHNRVSGDLEWFCGEEEIFRETERVYECRYHGGLVFNASL